MLRRFVSATSNKSCLALPMPSSGWALISISPYDAEEHTIKVRPTANLPAGDERQQRPIGAGEQKKPDRAHQCTAQV
jgi:hypothetical protein